MSPWLVFLHLGLTYRQQNNVTQIGLTNILSYFAVLMSIPRTDSEFFFHCIFLLFLTFKGSKVENCIPELNVSCVNMGMCNI